jgi:hypothetical protein
MNQFLHDLAFFQETGDLPDNNDYMINRVRELIEKSDKIKWQKIRKDFFIRLDNLSYEQLMRLEEDLTGFKVMPIYKIAEILNLKEQEQAMKDEEMQKGLELNKDKQENL